MYEYIHIDDAPVCGYCDRLQLNKDNDYCPYCNFPIDWSEFNQKQKEEKEEKNVSK